MLVAVLKRQTPRFGWVFLVPTLLFELVGSSKFWAPGNPAYGAYDAFFSDPRLAALSALAICLIIAGPPLAFALSAIPLTEIRLRQEAGTLVGTLTLRESWIGFATIALSLLTFGVMAVYLFLENFQPR